MKKIFLLIMCTLVMRAICAQVITNNYDGMGRLIQVVYPDSSIINYTYDNAGNRTSSNTQNICFIKPRPSISAGGNLTICSGDSVLLTSTGSAQYLWSNGKTSQSIVVKKSGKYAVTALYSSTCSKTSDSVFVTVNLSPIAVIKTLGNAPFCVGDSVELKTDTSAGYSYNWSTGSTSPSTYVTTSGSYTLKITTTDGCSDTSHINIVINPLPVADAGPNSSVCAGNSVIIGTQAAPGYTYQWSPSTELSDPHAATPSVNPLATTLYKVKVTNKFGCTASSNTTVTVNTLPSADAGNNIAIKQGATITIGGTPTAKGNQPFLYKWSPADGLNSSAIANPLASPVAKTTYTVKVTDAKGCSDTSSILVFVVAGGSNFMVYPNPFKNVLTIVGAGLPNTIWDVTVFNAVGQLVSKTKAYSNNNSMFYQLSMANLASGTYLLTVGNDSYSASFKVEKTN